MTSKGFTYFFPQYLDPLKKVVAEWGAFTGYHGRDREPAIEQVKKLAATTLVAADLVVPTVSRSRARLASTEASRAAIRARLYTAYCRCIGTKPFSSTRPHRIIIEGTFGLRAFLGLPIALVASWPLAAFRRRALYRVEREEGAMVMLAKAAEDYLTTEFEWHFQKGDEARRQRTAQSSRNTGRDSEARPIGDENFLNLCRAAKCIPIVATQSISSLRDTIPAETWRTILQGFATTICLRQKDLFTAETISKMCGRIDDYREHYSFSEGSQDAKVSWATARTTANRSASINVSHSYNLTREYLFEPKILMELPRGCAVVLANDGDEQLRPSSGACQPWASCVRCKSTNGQLAWRRQLQRLVASTRPSIR